MRRLLMVVVIVSVAGCAGCGNQGKGVVPSQSSRPDFAGRTASTTSRNATSASSTPKISALPTSAAAADATAVGWATSDQKNLADPRSVLVGFESVWCRFRWDEAPAARVARARVFMSRAGAASLVVPVGWWLGQVEPNRTVASCAGVRVFEVEGPSDLTRTVLRAVVTRTSVDTATGRSAVEEVTDQRWLVRVSGRWLVDVVTGGG